MNRNVLAILVLGFLVAGIEIALAARTLAGDSCANLASNGSALPNTTINSAEVVSGNFTPANSTAAFHGLPSFCRVTATLKPSPVSDIRVEIWLPTSGWNQKLQGVGNGGLAGTISYGALAEAIKAGYASVSTDTGHVASDLSWLPVEERERDYGYRAIHGMTVTARNVVQQFYGSAPRRSYFSDYSVT